MLAWNETFDQLSSLGSTAGISGPQNSALALILVLLAVLATDLWVYADAKAHYERGIPVVFSTGFFEMDTPAAWFFGCLLLWIVFFPLYIGRRNQVD
jgi:hypothetical protein